MRLIVSVLAILLTAGCASTMLKLHLDIYDDEPGLAVPLTPARVATLYQALDLADREAQESVDQRTNLADHLFAAYESYARLDTVAGGGTWDNSTRDLLHGGLERLLNQH